MPEEGNVCGTDDAYDDVLIMADSYDITDHYQDGYYIVPFGRFFDMWREGPCAQKTSLIRSPLLLPCPVNSVKKLLSKQGTVENQRLSLLCQNRNL